MKYNPTIPPKVDKKFKECFNISCYDFKDSMMMVTSNRFTIDLMKLEDHMITMGYEPKKESMKQNVIKKHGQEMVDIIYNMI